jgi:hypothetical protein
MNVDQILVLQLGQPKGLREAVDWTYPKLDEPIPGCGNNLRLGMPDFSS